MKDNYDILADVELFHEINSADRNAMLSCLNAETIRYRKNEIILLAGDRPEYIGVILSGMAHIVKEDSDGNRMIVAILKPGDFFAEALCCASVDDSPVTVAAGEDTKIMRINFQRILRTCSSSCSFHQKLIGNMLGIVARKNLFLQSRMEIVCMKTIREKVLKYLESCGAKKGVSVTVPLNREEMADYLSADRSALSHELMRMKRMGIIEYKRRVFTLL